MPGAPMRTSPGRPAPARTHRSSRRPRGPPNRVRVRPSRARHGARRRTACVRRRAGHRSRGQSWRRLSGPPDRAAKGLCGAWRRHVSAHMGGWLIMATRPSTAPQPGATDPAIIRNFCIIAHIDHGKSTLADRMLQHTGIVDDRTMRAQYLDRMDIERERGITIKAQNVRLPWRVGDEQFVLHLIDTPGHVDFTYEVSRALEACEGAILLVDAAQGIEAQTLANLYLALDRDLEIIPVLNKIDLPAADPDRYAAELAHIIDCDPADVLRVSGTTGQGVAELLDVVVTKAPPPTGGAAAPRRAQIFAAAYP